MKHLISNTDCSEANYYILAYYKIKKQSVTKFINLQEHIDLDLINYLEDKPFFKYSITYKKLTEDKYLSCDEDNFKLNQAYDFLINNKIVHTDIINKKLCTIEENYIIIPVCHFKKILLTKLKDLREYKKLSIYEMADILCISSDTYISIEKGHQKLSPYVMWKLEKEFGILLANVLNIDEYYKFCCEN
ncbi:MAG: helix-turn-helix domain-containing protein [Romboutsia sp.]|nr:helix-turn-helix domain-containing protein [Romboutsia sp.]